MLFVPATNSWISCLTCPWRRPVVAAEIQISEKDYFTRAMEFKVWLYHKKKKKYFEDLTSAESHELFEKFVKDWNRWGIVVG